MSPVIQFADDTELNTWDRRAKLQEDLDRLEGWDNKNPVKFNKDKHGVLHLGKHNPRVQHRLGSARVGSSSVERALGIPVNKRLNMSEHGLLRQRNPMEYSIPSTRASPGERKKSFSHSIQCCSGHTKNNVINFIPHYAKEMWTGWRRSREGPQ